MGTKRGNNEGSIRKRADGTWEARISLNGGKRVSLYGKTRKIVADKLAEALRDSNKGLPVTLHERTPLATYFDDWLVRTQPTIRASTHRRYRELLAHTRPDIGTVALAKLTPAQLDRVYARLQAPIDGGGEGLSPSTVRRVHTVMHKALKDAVLEGLVARNVADIARPPKNQDFEPQLWTLEQVRTFLHATAQDRLGPLYLLAALTGLRSGELLGLRWQDVDLDAQVLQVRVALARDGRLAPPKTRAGRRRVELSRMAALALRRQRRQQAEERLALGPAWHESDQVSTSTVGTLLDGVNTLKAFHRFLTKAELPRIRLHDLRHLQASLLLAAGVHPKVVSERLGHSRTAVTLDVYSHVMPSLQRDAADLLDRLLGEWEDSTAEAE